MPAIIRRWALLAIVAVLALAATRGAAQDAVAVSANIVKVKLENDRVRVLDYFSNPGDREAWHSHPAMVVYVITGGTLRVSTPDGKTSNAEFKAGDVIYRPPIKHATENVGGTQLHAILVELKPEASK
jgi:quercetin dioxygenase-like cupin family protein